MKLKSVLLLVITSFAALLVSATPAKAQNYRYRDCDDQYGYEQRPRTHTEVITRKVYYRDNCGRLYCRYEQVVIPSRACVEEVYEAAPAPYYRGSYSRYGSSRLPNLPNPPQPHKYIEKGAKDVMEAHKSHQKKFFGWLRDRF